MVVHYCVQLTQLVQVSLCHLLLYNSMIVVMFIGMVRLVVMFIGMVPGMATLDLEDLGWLYSQVCHCSEIASDSWGCLLQGSWPVTR